MASTVQNQASSILRTKKNHKRWLAIVICLAVVVAIGTVAVLTMPGVAMTHQDKVLDCPYEDAGYPVAHTHNDDCYDGEGNLVCGLPELEEHVHDASCYTQEQRLICGLEESEAHTHDESCYETVDVLTCDKVETVETHVHGADCFKTVELTPEEVEALNAPATAETAAETPAPGTAQSTAAETAAAAEPAPEDAITAQEITPVEPEKLAGDPNADVETASDWSAMFAPVTLTGDWNEDLVAVAKTQIGYTESAANYIVNDAGEQKGYTRYGAWAGNPYANWSAMFVSFCLNYAEIPTAQMPQAAGVPGFAEKLTNKGIYNTGAYEPKSGDLEFVDTDGNGSADHMGIAYTVNKDANELWVIEGNVDNAVKYVQYALTDSKIVGYGVLPEEPKTATETGTATEKKLVLMSQPDEPTMPAQTFMGSADGMKVNVTAPEGAFPEGTTMVIAPVYDEETLNTAANAVEGEVRKVQAVDITFYNADGEEIEPALPIEVVISGRTVTAASEPVVVHVDNEGAANVVDGTATTDTVTFQSDSFSVYAVVDQIVTRYLSANGATYEVTVTYTSDAKIPEGATLSVTEFAEGSTGYNDAWDALLADLKARDKMIDLSALGFAALDISIHDASGAEIEPAAPVQVSMTILDLPGVENLAEVAGTIAIQHHVETDDGVILETVYEGGETEASFTVDTDQTVVASGDSIVVEPGSVTEADFELGLNRNDDEVSKIEADFTVEYFSTYSIYYYYNRYSKSVHYVDENGNSLTPSMAPYFDSRYQFLVYDIDGYEYSYTARGSRTGTHIQPILRGSNNSGNYYSNDLQYINENGNQWYNLGNNDVYVVYKAKTEPTTGGTATVSGDDQTWPEGNDTPQFSKSSVNNGDGTNTITLSIAAAEKEIQNATKANVIVVLDVSASMSENMNGQSRMARARTAVNNLADTLLSKTDGAGNKLVKMALITFGGTANIAQGLTDNPTTFKSKVPSTPNSGSSYEGATNWEQALALANNMTVDSDAATYIVFVTDGDPTFRMSRGNVSDSNLDNNSSSTYQPYREKAIFGEGNADTYGRNFNFAVEQVKSIVAHNKTFYAIGVSNAVTKVQNLTTQGGVAANHAFLATDNTALTNAFNSIVSSITSDLGFGDVQIKDGITEMTNMEMKVMQTVDESSFQYYRYGGENNKYGTGIANKTPWTTREADGCAPATYNSTTGAVEWNMGAGFQLEDDVGYVVTFRVWPSQDAYDLVADLNNGIKVFEEGHENSITAAERAQVVELSPPTATTQGSYALKTNTDEVSATYKKTTKTGETVAISDTNPIDATYHEGTIQNMGLESEKLTIKKIFEDDLTSGEDRETEVVLVLQRRVTDTGEYAPYPVPQGTTTSANIVLNEGNNWQYEFYVAPGLKVDGEVLEKGYQFSVTEPNIDYHYDLLKEDINPMVVDGHIQWIGDTDGNTSLTATNRVKSGIDIKKVLLDENGAEIKNDQEFTIKGKLLDSNGNPFTWQEGDSVDNSGAYHKYDKDGNRIVYKGHFADSSNIEFTLKPGESIRFINVPEGCTFEFDEGTMADGYEWKSTTAVTQHRVSAGGDFTQEGDTQPVVTNSKAELTTGVVGNKQYSVTFTNQITPVDVDVTITKVDDDGMALDGATFELYQDATKIDTMTLGSKTYTNKLLPNTVYRLTETKSPDGYVIMTSNVYFKIVNKQLVLTDESGMVIEENGTPVTTHENATVTNEETELTITVSNTAGTALPMTGGAGTRNIITFGITLCAVSALLLAGRVMMSKKRKARGNEGSDK